MIKYFDLTIRNGVADFTLRNTQSVHETQLKNKLLVELNALALTNSYKRK